MTFLCVCVFSFVSIGLYDLFSSINSFIHSFGISHKNKSFRSKWFFVPPLKANRFGIELKPLNRNRHCARYKWFKSRYKFRKNKDNEMVSVDSFAPLIFVVIFSLSLSLSLFSVDSLSLVSNIAKLFIEIIKMSILLANTMSSHHLWEFLSILKRYTHRYIWQSACRKLKSLLPPIQNPNPTRNKNKTRKYERKNHYY